MAERQQIVSVSQIDQTLEEGARYHAAGRLRRAARCYRRALAMDPGRADVLHRLGVLALQSSDARGAAEFLQQAVTLKPADAPALCDLGNALVSSGRVDEAIRVLRKAIESEPNLAAAHCNLGTALKVSGDLAGAETAFRQAIAIDATMAQAESNLGGVLADRAEFEDAAAHCRAAIALIPDYAEAHNNLAAARKGLNRFGDAEISARRALQLNPHFPEAWSTLGSILYAMLNLDDAEAAFRHALDLKPAYADAACNLGGVLYCRGQVDDAVKAFESAIAIDPDCADAHLNLGKLHLLAKDLSRFWDVYDWRWRSKDQICARRPFSQPTWDGTPLDGKHVLCWAEQGIGDEIMFAGLIPEIAEQAADVTVEVDARLVPLLARSFPDVHVIARRDPPEEKLGAGRFDVQTSMIEAARRLRPSFEQFKPIERFLVPDAGRIEECRTRYDAAGPGAKIGIAWWSRHPTLSRHYSIDLAKLVRTIARPDVTIINVQYGDHRKALEDATRDTGIPIVNDPTIDPLKDLDGFAAQIAALDAVVTIDNSTLPMAAGLGKPVIGMLSYVCDWRWFSNTEECLWYPTVQLVRQDCAGNWDSVIENVGNRIAKLV
jgi:tetratricopeptide (TPR) repeat protein